MPEIKILFPETLDDQTQGDLNDLVDQLRASQEIELSSDPPPTGAKGVFATSLAVLGASGNVAALILHVAKRWQAKKPSYSITVESHDEVSRETVRYKIDQLDRDKYLNLVKKLGESKSKNTTFSIKHSTGGGE